MQCLNSTMVVLEAVMDVVSGADRYLGITFGLQAVESSSHVSVVFREAFYPSLHHFFFIY